MKSLKDFLLFESSEDISQFLQSFWKEEDWYDEIYGALVDEEDDDYEEQTKLNLIDNGYCLTVCLCVSTNFEGTAEGKKIEYYLLDDGGTSYHFLMKKDDYYYDAYNCYGEKKLSDLQFCKIYMKGKIEKYLQDNLKLVDKGEFDYNKAQSLVE